MLLTVRSVSARLAVNLPREGLRHETKGSRIFLPMLLNFFIPPRINAVVFEVNALALSQSILLSFFRRKITEYAAYAPSFIIAPENLLRFLTVSSETSF